MKKTYKKFAWGGFNFGSDDGSDPTLTAEQQSTLEGLDPQGQQNYLKELGYEPEPVDNSMDGMFSDMAGGEEAPQPEKKKNSFDASNFGGGSGTAAIFDAIGDSVWKKDERERMTGNEAVQRNASKRTSQFAQAGNSIMPGLGGWIGTAVGGIWGAAESGKIKKGQEDINFRQDTADAAAMQADNLTPNKRFNWNELADGGPVLPIDPNKNTQLSEKEEKEFRNWYSKYSTATGNSGNPDDKEHYYDYRAYWKNADPMQRDNISGDMHLDSKYKKQGHPRLYTDEFNAVFSPIPFGTVKKDTREYAEGGKVSGPGTEKSDSIKGRLPEDSFVVPAENADIAEALRATVLGKNTGRADMDSGEPVKLSNNEHVFTPQEVDKLAAKGVDMDKLAPDADKSKKMHPDREKFRGSLKNREIAAMVDDDAYDYMESTVGEGWTKELSEDEIGGMLSSPEYSEYYSNTYADGGKVKKLRNYGYDEEVAKELSGYLDENLGGKWWKTQSAEEIKDIFDSENYLKYLEEKDRNEADEPTSTAEETPSSEKSDVMGQAALDAAEESGLPPEEEKSGTGQKIIDAFGGTAGALSLAQIGFGLANELIEGKRPSTQVDPDLVARLDDAKRFDNRGFTPEQWDKVVGNIESTRLANNQSAVNVSGGNAGVALAGQRSANAEASDSFLDAVSRDNAVMMQNKGRTDNLAVAKSGQFRQIQQDILRGFDQNQAANADLIGAGLHNFIGNLQYRQLTERENELKKKKEQEDMDKLMSSITSQSTI